MQQCSVTYWTSAFILSKINNTQRTAQSLGVTLDHRMDFYALGAYWMRRTLCVVIFGRIHCKQTVHLIFFTIIIMNMNNKTVASLVWKKYVTGN